MPGIDLIDNLQVSGQHVLEHLHRPSLQGLRKEGVVSVGKCLGADAPGFVPTEFLLVHEDVHEFRDRHGWMSVIKLDRHLQCVIKDKDNLVF